MKTLFSCFIPATLALLAGCGSLSQGDQPEVLATLEGRLIDAQNIQAPDSMRVAVVWISASEFGGLSIAQDVEVEPVFPSNFKLALRTAPPESAMVDHQSEDHSGPGEEAPDYNPDADNGPNDESGGGVGPQDTSEGGPVEFDLDDIPTGVRLAVGTLIAYEDTNGNGKLDLVDIDATQFVDRVLGANPELMLVYAEGDVDAWHAVDSQGNALRQGYQLFQLQSSCPDEEQEPTPVGCDDQAGECGPVDVTACEYSARFLPVQTVFDLPVSNDPELNEMMCTSTSRSESVGVGGGYPGQPIDSTDPGAAGYPPASEVECDEDGRAYRVTSCIETNHGPCRGTSSSCSSKYIGLPAEGGVPAGWPCPAP